MRIRNSDILSGLAFLFFGIAFAIPAFSYGLGTTLRLGPGAFPLIVSTLLILVGVLQISAAIVSNAGEDIKPVDLRAMAAIVCAIIFGALTIHRLGVIIAVPGSIAIASLASKEFSFKTIALSSIGLTLFTWLIFIKALQVRLPLLTGVL